MSDSNTAAINSLLSQSISTIQQQVITSNNIIASTQNLVQSNTVAISVNSSSINTNTDQLSNLEAQVGENTSDISSLTVLEASDFALATQRLNKLDASMNSIFALEAGDMENLQSEVDAHSSQLSDIVEQKLIQDASLNLVKTQTDLNTNDIIAMKNWDGTFISEFQDVYSKISTINSDISDIQSLNTSQSTFITNLTSKETQDVLDLQAQITTNSNDILAIKNQDINFDSHFTQVQSKLDAIDASLNSISTTEAQDVDALTSHLSITDASLNSLKIEYDSTASTVSEHSSAISVLQENDAWKGNALESHQSQITTVDERLTSTRVQYDSQFDEKNSQISIIGDAIQNINYTQIPAIQSDVSTNASNILTLQSDLSTTSSTLSTVSTKAETNRLNISAIQGEIEIIQNGISTNSSNLNGLSTSVSGLSSSISGLQSQIQTVQNQPGPKGDKGDQGDMGPRGYQGIQGIQGNQGIQGIKGDIGDTGPQGLQGFVGATGATGPQGLQGLPGTNGTNGATGPQGLPGTNGTNGATGPQGLQGLAGTNGTNGATGATGPQGPTGLSGASQLGVANTWTALQTFSAGVSSSSQTISGALNAQGNATLGTTGTNSFTINSSATFNQPPIMSGANISASTIPSSAIVGGVGSSYANISKTNKTYTYATTTNNFVAGNAMDSLTLTGPIGSVYIITCNYSFTAFSGCPQVYCGAVGLSQNNTCANGNTSISLNTGGTDYISVNTVNGYNVSLPSTSWGWANPLSTLFVTTSTNQAIYFNSYLFFTQGLNSGALSIKYNFYAQRLA